MTAPVARMLEAGVSVPDRVLAALWAGITAAFVFLGTTAPWGQFEFRGFDHLMQATAPGNELPIVIVSIDEPSFKQVGKQWPWPRSTHATLIDQLSKAGALVIAFDVVMAESQSAEEDAALARAIRKAGNVVMASDLVYQEDKYARQWIRVEPLPQFIEAGAGSGYANVKLDPDLVVRRMPEGNDVFWRAIVRRANERKPGMLEVSEPDAGAMIRYAGRDRTYPYVSYYQALKADTHLQPGSLQDQIVIVGRQVKATTDQQSAQADLFATPFTSETGWLTPGSEIHANILETAIRDNAIVPAPASWGIALILATTTVCALPMRRWRPIPSGLVLLAVVAALAALSALLFIKLSLWLPVFAAMGSAAMVYASFGAVSFLTERRHRSETRRAFSLYMSPEVVDHVLAHPESLKLGGERREVTCFFSDLEGFTSITEKIGAEQVARVLNMHFTRATAIIKSHGGTVNRFIGDAIMALWGAPLDDPQQASHAVRAAHEVQEDIKALRVLLAAEGLPQIKMRIGIHSCVAVVGNLGSDDRFDYTAIGDGVNLAARLEGVNKLYRTEILVSGETVAKLDGTLPMRVVDRVIVKGKSEPVDIYTPCTDAAVKDLTGKAIAAYRARGWNESLALWREILERDPDDGVAALYVERVEKFRAFDPSATWSGAVELEKL
jgi:adenylate cyclase